MSNGPRILVVDGYSKEGRDGLAAGGASPAGDLYARMLKACAPDCETDIVYPADPGASLPSGAAIGQYDGVAWTGSSLTVYADDPNVHSQIDFARAAFEAKVPSFGSCWAAQIAVAATGGVVAGNARGREMGFARKIALTAEGRGHPLYFNKKSVFDAFISHEDEVTHLPPGGVLLASNGHSQVQAVTVTHKGGVFWGLQYHPEYDLHELARLCFCRKQRLTDMGFFADMDAAQRYVDLLETLFQDPSRHDIAWLLGVDEDVMNEDVRRVEVRNWFEYLVRPTMRG